MQENTVQVPFINRELSWMDFNERVLEEAFDKDTPILERLRFLAITASNLDEFFMVRVAGVKAQVQSNVRQPDLSGLTPAQLLEQLTEKIRIFVEKQYSCLQRSIKPVLKNNGIRFLTPDKMDDAQRAYISDYFERMLYPVLTPLAVDTSRPFPKLANKSLNIAVRLQETKDGDCFALVQVPAILSRVLEVPSDAGRAFVLLEHVIIYKLASLFTARQIEACCMFRMTRNADLEIDEEAEDLMAEVEKSIKKRKRGRPVRLEIAQRCDPQIKRFLKSMLGVKKEDIFEVPEPLDLTLYAKFAGTEGLEALCYQSVRPVNPPADFWGCDDIFGAIREKDRMVHHPYESFACVVDFVRRAAEDPDVLAIKQTLYRVSGNSPIVAALIRAAENGKQVTVLVELKARFDEENNIQWAKKLEDAGCHVIYGIAGLKTHCKILLVVRREEDGIRRYVHMATGNYNDSTANVYTDVGLFTCGEPYGVDASSLFNTLTGYSRAPQYRKFIVAPHDMRDAFAQLIRREIRNARQNLPCGITAKVNSLIDPGIIALLYEASQAGVPIALIVRGMCSLVAGVPGFSETISVRSIVGRYLEHSRIFRFENGGNPKVFMGSADWMQRNLDRRVELVFPIEDAALRQRAFDMLDLMLADNANARVMQPDGSYQRVDRRGRATVDSQKLFAAHAREAVQALQRVDKDQPFQPIRMADLLKERIENQ
nr:RNA degradosome polyphosphate kinase [Maliibacterium massiliense]